MSNLPYNMPSSIKDQLLFLAKVTNIPKDLVIHGGEKERDALSMMILYRHLDRHQKIDAMTLIHSLNNPKLKSIIIAKAVDTLVNPQWGIWSLSNEELQKDIKFHRDLDKLANTIGFSASILSGKALLEEIFVQKKIGKAQWAILVILGCVQFNKHELAKAQNELDNRQTLNTSGFYQ